MQNIIKNFINNHWRLIKVVLTIIMSPVLIYIAAITMKTIFNMGNYIGTFLRGVYVFFTC